MARCYPYGDGCGNPDCPCTQDYNARVDQQIADEFLLTQADDEELDLPPALPSDLTLPDDESSDEGREQEDAPLSMHQALAVFEQTFRRTWLGESPECDKLREKVQALAVAISFGERAEIEQESRTVADAISQLVEEKDCALLRVKMVQERLGKSAEDVLARIGEEVDASIQRIMKRGEDAPALVAAVGSHLRSA